MVATDLLNNKLKMHRFLDFILFLVLSTDLFSQNWNIQTIDDIGYYWDTSIVVDTLGFPHVAYTGLYGSKYAKWNGNTWELQSLSTDVGTTIKICLDHQGYPHIAYFKQYPQYYFQIIYTYWDGLSWQNTKIDSFYAGSYFYSAIDLGMTLTSTDIPYMSYPWINLADSIWEVRCAYKSSDRWIINTIWRKRFGYRYANAYRTRIALDTAESPVIAYDVDSQLDTCYIDIAYVFADTWVIERFLGYWREVIQLYDLKIDVMNRLHLLYFIPFPVLYAKKENNTWTIEFTEITNDASSNYGSLALYCNNPHAVACSPLCTPTYAYKQGAIWYTEEIFSFPSVFISLAIDRQGNKHVCYASGPWLYYARRIALGIEENVERVSDSSPSKELSLSVSSPISFNLKISYGLPKDGKLKLLLYDITGRTVCILKDGSQKLGYYTETFNLRNQQIATGIYYLVLVSDQEKKFKKLVIIR